MTGEYQKALGRKIAFHRKARGLSQREFARLVERSEAWVSQVERGVRRVDRMTVLESVAGVLDVPVAELAAEAPVLASGTEEPTGGSRLRLVLSSAYSLRALLLDGPSPDTADLRSRVGRAWELTHAARYDEFTDLMETLVPDLETAVRGGQQGDRSEAFRLMAAAYQACAATLAKLGEPEAGWIAADRAIGAAERAGDLLLMAAGSFRLAIMFQQARHFGQAEATAGSAADALAPSTGSGGGEALSLWGALTLQRAVAAARTNDADAAYAHLEAARQAADRLGGDRNDYNTEFGPTNVALHEVAVAVELGDAGMALRTVARLDTSHMSAERRARLLIDTARAHRQRGHTREAIRALHQAEELTPEQVHGLDLVRHLVSDLLSLEDEPAPELRALAQRVDLLPR